MNNKESKKIGLAVFALFVVWMIVSANNAKIERNNTEEQQATHTEEVVNVEENIDDVTRAEKISFVHGFISALYARGMKTAEDLKEINDQLPLVGKVIKESDDENAMYQKMHAARMAGENAAEKIYDQTRGQ